MRPVRLGLFNRLSRICGLSACTAVRLEGVPMNINQDKYALATTRNAIRMVWKQRSSMVNMWGRSMRPAAVRVVLRDLISKARYFQGLILEQSR